MADLSSLNGVRVLMTLWMVTFHTTYFSATFMQDEAWTTWYSQPRFAFIRNGLAAVDVFFVLTGFLLSFGLFERATAAAAAAVSSSSPTTTTSPATKSSSSSSSPPVSWRAFVWRRAVRLYPTYAVVLALHCLVLNRPYGGQFPLSLMPSKGVAAMVRGAYPASSVVRCDIHC
jgi:peptidoglycan/LPS O-acetylase OafA/YrhL